MCGVHSEAWLSYCTALYDLFEHGDFFEAWLSYCTACVVILRLYIYFPHHWYGSYKFEKNNIFSYGSVICNYLLVLSFNWKGFYCKC